MLEKRGAPVTDRLSGRGAPRGEPDPEATVKVKRTAHWRRLVPVASAVLMVLGVSAGAYNLWRSTPAPAPASASASVGPGQNVGEVDPRRAIASGAVAAPAVSAPMVAAVDTSQPQPQTPAFQVTTATEAEILADEPADMTMFRFSPNPAIVVLDFARLGDQAQMLNRMAVFEEKDGYPHDRLLSDQELDAAIRNGGDEPATFYYGHDYRADALIRFFSIADRDHVALTAQERRLRLLITQLGWTQPGAVGALITLPRLNADATIDPQARATILRHELSHGEYFTNPAYAAFTQHFWHDLMTEADRAGFRRFLIADHYDGGIDDLMMNEGQAYLMHTHDPRFFTAQFVGLTPARIEELRQMFMAGMPRGWLRDATLPPPVAITPATAAAVRRAPRARPLPGDANRETARDSTSP
jgi:hypothetical protein